MTSHPESKQRSEMEGRPQTQQHTRRKAKAKDGKALPDVARQKPKSAVPVKETRKRVRLALPWTNKGNVSDKYWDLASRQSEVLWGGQVPGKPSRPMTVASVNQLGTPFPIDEEENAGAADLEERGEERRRGMSQPKSYKFLAKLGGNLAFTEDLLKSEPTEFKDAPGFQGTLTAGLAVEKKRKKTLTIFTDYNVDDYAKRTTPKTARLVSAKVKSSKEPNLRELRPVSSYLKKQQQRFEAKVPRVEIPEPRRPMSALPRYVPLTVASSHPFAETTTSASRNFPTPQTTSQTSTGKTPRPTTAGRPRKFW